MNKLTKKIVISIFAFALVIPLAAYSQQSSTGVYERALMRYVLSYEALIQAKEDPNKSEMLPQYITNYRRAYFEYILCLKDNGLYEPDNENVNNDPAGNLNKQLSNNGNAERFFKNVNTHDALEQLNCNLRSGQDISNAINNTTNSKVPEKGHSVINLNTIPQWNPSMEEPPCGWDEDKLWSEWEKQRQLSWVKYDRSFIIKNIKTKKIRINIEMKNELPHHQYFHLLTMIQINQIL